jgi:hypothetical protein
VRGGQKRKLSQVECEIAADQLARGTGLGQTLFNVNDLRRAAAKSEVSRTTLRDSVKRVLGAKRQKTKTRPTGNKDVNSSWAKARLAQAKQYLEQLRKGGQRMTRRGASAAATPLELASIAWWDEKHKKIRLGCMGKHTWTYPVGGDGRYLSEADGGACFEPAAQTVPKFAEEARFAFGVMMKSSDGGRTLTGVRMEPFEYTGKKMLGVAAYEKAVKGEVDAAASKKGGAWAKVRKPTTLEGSDSGYLKGGRWFLLHGTSWEDKISDFLKLVCVTKLIDHIISEGDIAFAHTPFASTWVIGHDALSQFTEKGAQAYLLAKGFGPDRQLGPKGETNEGSRYSKRAVGDSPELMCLDSNLLADVVYGLGQNCAATWQLLPGNPLKFSMGTPAEVSSSLRRTWQVCPTSERIVQDISRFPAALEKIIAAEGAYVPELDKRSGRRQRKATRRFAYHPDCTAAKAANEARCAQWLRDAGPSESEAASDELESEGEEPDAEEASEESDFSGSDYE